MSLPYDIARCLSPVRNVCIDCRRREPVSETRQTYIAPPATNDACEFKIPLRLKENGS